MYIRDCPDAVQEQNTWRLLLGEIYIHAISLLVRKNSLWEMSGTELRNRKFPVNSKTVMSTQKKNVKIVLPDFIVVADVLQTLIILQAELMMFMKSAVNCKEKE